jgi:hypothetical protein
MELVRRDEGREVEQFLKEHAGGDVLKARGYAGRTTLQRVIMARVMYAPQTYLFHARTDPAIEPTAADEHGWTALHTAAWLRDVRSLGALLALGADPAAKDKQGGTAADWARLRGYGDVIAAIEKHQRGSWKLTPAERAARAHAQRDQERELQRQQEQLQEQHLRQRP